MSNPPIHPVPRGKAHEVRFVDLLPEGVYRDFTQSRQVAGYFYEPKPVVVHYPDKIITTWYINAHNSEDCRNPIGPKERLNPGGSAPTGEHKYEDVKPRSKVGQIERWAREYSAEYYEHSDHSPEAEAARERAAAQAQRERQAAIEEATRPLQAQMAQMAQQHQAALDQMAQAHQDEINRLREELAGRGTEVDELNQQVEDQRADLEAKDQEVKDLRSQFEDKQAAIDEAQIQARQIRNGGYQVGEGEDDDDEEDDDIHFGLDEDDDAGYANNGGAGGGIPADGAGGGGVVPAEQQQQQQQGRRGRGGASTAHEGVNENEGDGVEVEVGVQADVGEFLTLEKATALLEDLIALELDQLRREIRAEGDKDWNKFVQCLKMLQDQINTSNEPRMVGVGVDAAEGGFVTRKEVTALMDALEERMQEDKVDWDTFLTLVGKIKDRMNSVEESARSMKVVQEYDEQAKELEKQMSRVCK